eukprot:539615_1
MEPLLSDTIIIRNISSAIATISLLLNVAILCYHTFRTLPCITKIKIARVQYLSLFCLVMTVLFNLDVCFTSFGIHPSSLSCAWVIKLAVASYLFQKIALYGLLLERLFCVFEHSALKFQKYQVYPSRCIVVTTLLFILIIVFIFVDGITHHENYCVANYPFWINGLGAIIDIAFLIVISIMFARRLILLNVCLPTRNPELSTTSSMRSMSDLHNNNSNRTENILNGRMWKLLKKSTGLTFIALVTTELSLLLSGVLGIQTIWTSLDSVVNCLCIILMFQKNHKIYKALLFDKFIERCISIKCLACYSCAYCCQVKMLDQIQLTKSASEQSQQTNTVAENRHQEPTSPTNVVASSPTQVVVE